MSFMRLRHPTGRDPLVNVFTEFSERHLSEASQQQFLSVIKRLSQCGIHCLFYEAFRGAGTNADSQERRAPERDIDVSQRYLREITGQRPPAAVSLFRLHISPLPQASHDPPDDNRIGRHHPGEIFRCDGSLLFCHMEQDVEDAGKFAVAFHATYHVT